MTQPPSSGYGRPGYPTYGASYPPQGPPMQGEPGRYYTPGPQGKSFGFMRFTTDIFPDGRPLQASQTQYPPTNGPQPFYMASQSPHLQQQYPTQPLDHRRPTPVGLASQQTPSDPYGGRRPESSYENPQELGAYPPGQTRPASFNPGAQIPQSQGNPPGNEYSASMYSLEENERPTGHEIPQTTYQTQQPSTGLPTSLQAQYPPQPTYAAYSQYGANPQGNPPVKAPSPAPASTPYPNLGPQPPQTYQAYQPSTAGAGSGPPPGAEGYYR